MFHEIEREAGNTYLQKSTVEEQARLERKIFQRD